MTRGNARRSAWTARSAAITPGCFRRSGGAGCAGDPGHGAPHGRSARDLEEELFVLMTLGDDRAVRQCYIAGEPAS